VVNVVLSFFAKIDLNFRADRDHHSPRIADCYRFFASSYQISALA
jgi:hypothetical protein